ncbi:MAG: molybdopterin cofactor-binding domain-containing protein [Bacteroidales bacterium]
MSTDDTRFSAGGSRKAAGGREYDDCDELVVDGPTAFPVDRRDFLKLTATGLLFMFSVRAEADEQREGGGRGQGYPEDFNAYLHIGADGAVTCLVGKVELGQGPTTALGQMLAEELDVSMSSVTVVAGDTDLCPYDSGTYGSMSVRVFGPALRQAGAEARGVLLQMASERLQVPVGRLVVKDGVVNDTADAKRSVTYGQLAEGKRLERHLDVKPPLKAVKAFRVIGRPAPRKDALEKVTGKAKYAGDIVPPGGALHARIVRPPAHGAVMGQVDTSAAEKVPGVRVIRDGDMVAVLHEHRDEADKAVALVKAQFTRNDPPVDDKTIFDYLVKHAPSARTVAEGGSLAEGQRQVPEVIEHTYEDNYVAHAPMEPHSAVAAVENGKVTIWAGTQTPFPLKSQVMQALRLPADKVRVITPYVGGGFGGKSASRQGVEAARLAMLTGKPVRVVWSREEEFFFDMFRPAAVVKIRSGIDASKSIALWDYTVYFAGERGAAHFYNIPNHRTTSAGGGFGGGANPHPFGTGAWRAPGNNTNAFARESQIDIMAAKAGMDPVEFRRKNLSDQRMLRVLDAAAKKFGWTPKPGPSGRGVGVACTIDAGSYNCMMVDVVVDKATGRVQVTRVVCAQDMGVVVNPEGALQQMEGCITMGLGYTLSEEVHFKGGEIFDTNFDTYQIPQFSWVPRIEPVLVENPDLAPQGGGEPAIVPVGAAVANAIFDATGARLFRLSMTPARVKEALART